jgi:hypothetical protein
MTSTPLGYQRSPCRSNSRIVLLGRVRKYSPSSTCVPSDSNTKRTGSPASTPSFSFPASQDRQHSSKLRATFVAVSSCWNKKLWHEIPQVEVTLRQTVSRPVFSGIRPPSGTRDQFFFTSTEIILWHLHFYSMGRPLWREVGSVIYSYNCYWGLPALSLLSPSRTRLVTICYFSFETGIHFCRLLLLAGLRWRYSNLPPHRVGKE